MSPNINKKVARYSTVSAQASVPLHSSLNNTSPLINIKTQVPLNNAVPNLNHPRLPTSHVQYTQPTERLDTPRKQRKLSPQRNPSLQNFKRTRLGIDTSLTPDQNIGKSAPVHPSDQMQPPPQVHHKWPSPTQLRTSGFGKLSKRHHFRQTACFETSLLCILKSKFLDSASTTALCATHPLIHHLCKMTDKLRFHDFSTLQQYNEKWSAQTTIPHSKAITTLAALLHYDGRVSDVMRFAGNNYTGEYRNIKQRIKKLSGMVDEYLLLRYYDVMTLGAPTEFTAETSRENAMLHLRMGNHPSVAEKHDQVMVTMNKEERNNFVIAFPNWMARFTLDIFFTPQHILVKTGKSDRQITDASRRYTPTSVPINMMTSTNTGVELNCGFGDTLTKLLTRIWRLRITYPKLDIIVHANDVKSCFRQLKHHPDVAGAFSYVIANYLYLQCGLSFGSDFSPQNWEICRRIIEQLAEKLFDDETLIEKHSAHLNKLQWGKRLGKNDTFVQAQACPIHSSVIDKDGKPENTPHFYFVDDGLIAEVYEQNRRRILQAVAASIEAIYLVLGESNLLHRQDPISWDKLLEMLVNYANIVLGHHVNTRKMIVSTSRDFLAQTCAMLEHWHSGRKSFTIPEIEPLIGKLGHIAQHLPWLRHLMGHLYTSLTAALAGSKKFLIHTSGAFRNLLKLIKHEPDSIEESMISSFALSESARKVHKSKKKFVLLPTAKEELRIIRTALASPDIGKFTPIAHLVKATPNGIAAGDSCLDAMGGYSIDMKFWWYHEWPVDIRVRTLRVVKDNKKGNLITINALEYATILVNYAASYHYWCSQNKRSALGIEYPSVLLLADNKSAESWTRKGCKNSPAGRALGRLQCSLMMNNPVGIDTAYINTKLNCIADDISRIKHESNILTSTPQLYQKYPSLGACRRFHPSPDLISYITSALLSNQIMDPLTIRQTLLKNPGKITGSSIAEDHASMTPL